MKTTTFHFPSATGVCEITGRCYEPEDGTGSNPAPVLVIHHGMAEHQRRYLGLIEFLCSRGIRVYMHDMANHGESNEDPALTGWFGEHDGWLGLVEDFRTMVERAAHENPGRKLFVMGHSMGSFLCRLYTSMYPATPICGAVFMGTGGPNPAAGAGMAAANLIGKLRGKKHKSRLLAAMAFGTYNKRFEKRTLNDWLTRDQAVVDAYRADPYCGFLFTVQGMKDLVKVNVESNKAAWYEAVPKDLPILLISGAEDPVGDYGRGVETVCCRLEETDHTHVTEKLYPDCRHEILNELNREAVMEDLAAWIMKVSQEAGTDENENRACNEEKEHAMK